MLEMLNSPGAWGLVGGTGYAGTRLSAALWTNLEVTSRARRMAWSQFAISMFLSPFAAHALTPAFLDTFAGSTMPPAAFVIGLSFNAVWPLLVERGFLRKLLADVMHGMADRLTPGGKE